MTLIVQFFRFGAVGLLGFVVDSGLLWLVVSASGNPYAARIFSFPPAVLTTWALNRIWTFPAADKGYSSRQIIQYGGLQAMGSLANLAVYVVVISIMEQTATNTVLALASGAVVGMTINFLGSWKFIFRETHLLPERKEGRDYAEH